MMTTSSAENAHIEIFYVPLPEDKNAEESAAFEFAHRASNILRSELFSTLVTIDISLLSEDIKSGLCGDKQPGLSLIVISCSADGSVHRTLRKFTKRVTADKELAEKGRWAVSLLGHSVCHNSANQMKTEVFRSGKKVAKALGVSPRSSVETQVELEAPEDGFDIFIKELAAKCVKREG